MSWAPFDIQILKHKKITLYQNLSNI
jgi:hypothetical protein